MAFQGFLRQSTAVDVLIGPFLDDTDGKTAETGLTISQADVKLSKNGQALAQKNDANAAVHDANGYHNCPLNTTDTNTVGQLTIIVHESGALPVRLDYHVVEEAVYDAMYASSSAGPLQSTTAGRTLDVNATGEAGADVVMVDGATSAAANLNSACDNYSATRGLAGTALPAAAANGVGGLPISATGGLDMDAIYAAVNSLDGTKILETLNLTASGNIGIDWANVENPSTAVDLSATDIQLCDTITTYTGNTKQTGDNFTRIGAAGVGLTAVALADATSDAVLADAVWNAATVTYGGVGSYGEHVESLSAGGDATEAKQDSIIATLGAAGVGLTAVPWNAAWDAQVESECNDALVALNLDHLMKTAVGNNADMTTEVPDGTVLSNIMSATSDTSTYVVGDDSLQAISEGAAGGATAQEVWEYGTRVLTAGTNLAGLEVDLTKIHGTALTETAGQLAGRFVNFFDQDSATFSVNTALADFKATGFAVAGDKMDLLDTIMEDA